MIKLRGQPASGYDALRGLPGAIKQHNKETNRQGKDVDLSTADHHTVGFHPWLNIGSARWLNIGSAPTSMINDLRDWDIHVEDGDYLSDDWLREAAFGEADTESECAEELAELFLQKCDEYDMDYDQSSDPDGFAIRVHETAEAFIRQWRARLLAGNSATCQADRGPRRTLPEAVCQFADPSDCPPARRMLEMLGSRATT